MQATVSHWSRGVSGEGRKEYFWGCYGALTARQRLFFEIESCFFPQAGEQ